MLPAGCATVGRAVGPRPAYGPVTAGPSFAAASRKMAWTNAWGRLPRSWRWRTSYSSVKRPVEQHTPLPRWKGPGHGQHIALLELSHGQAEDAELKGPLGLTQRTGIGW